MTRQLKPHCLRATLEWISETPPALRRPYLLEHASRRLCAALTRLDSAEVELETHRPLFAEPGELDHAARFALLDLVTSQTVATGVITGAAGDPVESAHGGLTVWFTGLSSAGKSTLSRAVCERLRGREFQVELLDGDEMRRHLCRDLGFSKPDRDENIRRIGFVAEQATRRGAIALVAVISPYREVRDEIRARIGAFVEVFVNAPLEVCEQRDGKGLYRKARAGQLSGFTGIDDPYEPPLTPEVECWTDRESLAESVEKVLRCLEPRLPR